MNELLVEFFLDNLRSEMDKRGFGGLIKPERKYFGRIYKCNFDHKLLKYQESIHNHQIRAAFRILNKGYIYDGLALLFNDAKPYECWIDSKKENGSLMAFWHYGCPEKYIQSTLMKLFSLVRYWHI